MNTAQNYADGEHHATPPEPAAQNSLQTVDSDHETPLPESSRYPNPVFDRHKRFLDPDYLRLFDQVLPQEYPRAGLITVADDEMAPELKKGYTLLAVFIDSTDYETVSGMVAVTTTDKPGEILFGRMQLVTPDEVWLVQQRPRWELVYKVKRSLISSLSSVRYIINGELV